MEKPLGGDSAQELARPSFAWERSSGRQGIHLLGQKGLPDQCFWRIDAWKKRLSGFNLFWQGAKSAQCDSRLQTMPKAYASEKGGQALRRRITPASHLRLECRVVLFLVGLAVSLASFLPGSWHRRVIAAQEAVPDVTSVPPTAARWEPVIAKFEAQEKVNPSPPGGTVFYGSSTIVRWDLKKYFPELVAINRGFGGSQMADARYFVGRVVIPLRPRAVVVYSGDNDLARGETPEKIAAEFRELCRLIHSQLPQTRIIVLGVKPSLARAHLLEKQRTVNQMLRAICESDPPLHFVDTEKVMLRADGSIREELLAEDGLHLSEEGYRVWSEALRPLLAEK